MVIYTPKTGAIFAFKGRTIRWIAGRTLIEEGAEILKGRDHLVRPMTIHHPADAAKAKPGKGDPDPAEAQQ